MDRHRNLFCALMTFLSYAYAHGSIEHHHEHSFEHKSPLSQAILWRNAFFATFAISFFPTIILVLIPAKWLTSPSKGGVNLQNAFLSFAAGGLLGDVFLHALPELLGIHDHDHEHHEHHEHHHMTDISQCTEKSCSTVDHHTNTNEHTDVHLIGIYVLMGFLVFFICEKLLTHHLNSESTSPSEPSTNNISKAQVSSTTNEVHNSTPSHATDAAHHALDTTHKHHTHLGVAGYLNLAADMMHNFTDGLAIGATFGSGHSLALATFLSVFFHEIPHELGDVSILIESGFTKTQAIYAQFGTAVAAFLGTAMGLCAQRNAALETLLLSVTCGGFVYIATVSIVPLLLAKRGTLFQSCVEIVAFSLGVGMMYVVALLEELE